MIEVRYFIRNDDRSPFDEWFAEVDLFAGAKVAKAIARIEQGNLSNLKSLRGGLFEYKIDFGPGYRLYLGRDGDKLIILLTGGTKKRQQRDIETAAAFWQEYKRTKRARR